MKRLYPLWIGIWGALILSVGFTEIIFLIFTFGCYEPFLYKKLDKYLENFRI